MATVHSMSVLTNSCIKPPLNPQTGMATTQYERSKVMASDEWGLDTNGSTESALNGHGFESTEVDLVDTQQQQDLTGLPDEEFYQRLQKLKEEHKKTLELCEELYAAKLESTRSSENGVRSRSRSPSPARSSSIRVRSRSPSPVPKSFSPVVTHYSPVTRSFSPIVRAHSPTGSTHSLSFATSTLKNNTPNKGRDMIRDMSASKPPLPKRCTGSPQVRSGSVNGVHSQAWSKESLTSSTDENAGSNGLGLTGSGDVDVKSLLDDSHQSALSKIEDMWENFSVEDYTPRQSRGRRSQEGGMRRRSNSLSRLSNREEKKEDDWRHRITIPHPFSMTKREESKEMKKSRAAIELEEQYAERERLEEEECQKKFKAKPVPAHVYMPLYTEIMEEQETRRRYNHQKSEELTKSQQKPFKLSTRENEMKKTVGRPSQFQEFDDTPKKEFKAKPFPEHIFGYSVLDKLAEEEEYRRIRTQMRSQELLKKSSLPPNMAARGQDYIHSKSRQKANAKKAQKARKAGLVDDFKFKPKVNDDIPDFDELHRKFLNSLGRKKAAKDATVCKPFNLRTAHIPSTKHKIYEDIARDEATMRERNYYFRNKSAKTPRGMTQHLSTSWDAIPAQMTTSAQLRASANKKKLEKQMEEELSALEAERKKRLRTRQLQKEVSERALANDNTPDLTTATLQKFRAHKAAERAQEEEYRRYMNEMQGRVEQRPLLFERTAQENARLAAERKYNATLQEHGITHLSDNTASQRSQRSRPVSARSSARSSRVVSLSGSRSPSPSRSYSRSHGTAKYSDDFDADDTHISDDEEEEAEA